jgi:hypothetical protein
MNGLNRPFSSVTLHRSYWPVVRACSQIDNFQKSSKTICQAKRMIASKISVVKLMTHRYFGIFTGLLCSQSDLPKNDFDLFLITYHSLCLPQ